MEISLQNIPLFSAFPETEIAFLSSTLRQIEVPAGAVLFQEGEIGDRLFVIMEGEIEIGRWLGAQEELLLGVLHAGNHFGEVSLLERDGRRTAWARARVFSTLLEMTRADFDLLLHRQPMMAAEMLRDLSARLFGTQEQNLIKLRQANQKLSDLLQELQNAQAQLVEKEKLERELQVAHLIQASLLPSHLPRMRGVDFAARMIPARAVGGDLFDFISFDRDTIGILVGDVSDKGVPAAIFMALTRSLLRAEASRHASPSRVLRRVNRHLLSMNETGMFVTLLYGILDRKSLEFRYCRAGHEIPTVFDLDGEMTRPQIHKGQMLGILDDPLLDEGSLTIPKGGLLLLYTDGLTDATAPNGEFFGIAGVRQAMQRAVGQTAETVCDVLVQAIHDFQGSLAQFDDLTLAAVHSQE